MSAKDRAERAMREREKRQKRMAEAGLREMMENPNIRATIAVWMLPALEAEGHDGAGRRALARDLMRALKIAAWDGLQIMREEWERPMQAARAEGEESDNVADD